MYVCTSGRIPLAHPQWLVPGAPEHAIETVVALGFHYFAPVEAYTFQAQQLGLLAVFRRAGFESEGTIGANHAKPGQWFRAATHRRGHHAGVAWKPGRARYLAIAHDAAGGYTFHDLPDALIETVTKPAHDAEFTPRFHD